MKVVNGIKKMYNKIFASYLETKKNKMIAAKMLSNVPVVDNESYGAYADILDSKVKDADVLNIGVIAPYGAGKSSLIATYKHKYCQHKISIGKIMSKKNMLTVSLGTFDDEKSNNADGVEKSILQQLLYSKKRSKTPKSNVDRIGSSLGWRGIPLFVGLFLFGVSIVAFMINIEIASYLKVDALQIKVLSSLLGIICLMACAVILIENKKLKSISLKGVDINIVDKEASYKISQFFDEILYFFKKTKVKVVIFEDIDRFNNVDLFMKIRELNQVINSSEIVSHKVTFIYAVREDLFEKANNKSKFFDFVLPILPVLNISNARDLIKENLNVVCADNIAMKLSAEYIDAISIFIDEKRVLNNIINDYMFYYLELNIKNFNKDKGAEFVKGANEQLFSLMVYKNMFPDDYVKLQRMNGSIQKEFDRKNQILEVQIKELEKEKNKIQKDLSDADAQVLNSFEMLRCLVIGVIENSNLQNSVNSTNNLKTISSFEGISDVTYAPRSSRVSKNCKISIIEAKLGCSLVEMERTIIDKNESTKRKMEQRIRDIEDELYYISGISFAEYCEKYEPEWSSGGEELITFFLKNGYITENYVHYISKVDDGYLTIRDIGVKKQILSKIAIDIYAKIDNPYQIIADLPIATFADRYILNFDIIKCLLANDDKDQRILAKKKEVAEYLSRGGSKQIEFIRDYLLSGYDVYPLIDALIGSYEDLWGDVYKSAMEIVKKESVLYHILSKYGDDIQLIIDLDKSGNIKRFLEESANVLGVYNDIGEDKLAQIIIALDVKLTDINCDCQYANLSRKLYEANCYEVNERNLKFISNDYSGDTNYGNSKILTNILKDNKNDWLLYIRNNMSIVAEILWKANSDNEEQCAFEYLFAEDIDQEYKNKFISIQKNKFDAFIGLSKEECYMIMGANALNATWENIFTMVEDCDITMTDCNEFISNNIDAFANAYIANDDIPKILDHEFSDIKIFHEIIKNKICENLSYESVENDKNRALLIEMGKIDYNPIDIKKSYNDKYSFIAYLKTYWDDVKENIDYNVIPIDIIEYIVADNKIDDEIKIHLLNKSMHYVSSGKSVGYIFELIEKHTEKFVNEDLIVEVIQTLKRSRDQDVSFILLNSEKLSTAVIKSIIATMKPYSDIFDGSIDKLKISEVKMELMKLLKMRGIISFKNNSSTIYGIQVI